MDSESLRTVKILSPVMAKNNEIAARTRSRLTDSKTLAFNLIGSPGSGKTSLLEAMATILGPAMAVIEGDVQTRRDADRIERAGCAAYQIETQGACHLNAQAVAEALDALRAGDASYQYLAIENVGNLICPSAYDLGEHVKVGMLSVPEGDDKILKYPSLFSRIDVLIINKIDLLPVLPFDIDQVKAECVSLSRDVTVFEVSAKTGRGVDDFCRFLEKTLNALSP